ASLSMIYDTETAHVYVSYTYGRHTPYGDSPPAGALRRRHQSPPATPATESTASPATITGSTLEPPPSSSAPAAETPPSPSFVGCGVPGSVTSSVGGVPGSGDGSEGRLVDVGGGPGTVGVAVGSGTGSPSPTVRSTCFGPGSHSAVSFASTPSTVNDTIAPAVAHPCRCDSCTTAITYAVASPWRIAGRSPGAAWVQSFPFTSARISAPVRAGSPFTVSEPK